MRPLTADRPDPARLGAAASAAAGATIERETVRAGEYLRIWLYWQSVAASQEDLRSVGQVVADGWRIAASEDDQIGRRRHFLSRWETGERSVDEMRIRIAPSVGPGEYGL